MAEQTHGHEVMKMMLSSEYSYTKESLTAAIIEKFGAATKFYTCSKEDMTASELVDFLESKGKFIAADSGFTTSEDKICNH